MILSAHGVAVELPAGWSGRVFTRPGGIARLHAGSFPIALSDGDFGGRTTASMPSGAAFMALTEYLPGAGLEPGIGLFAERKIPRGLDPAGFSSRTVAHPRASHAGTQHFFTAAGRPFCLYVVLAGARAERRLPLAAVDRVLGSLRIEPR